jgi:hypothetical protein
MARYEHLPIFRAAFDLALHLEKIVKNFSRYHKYTLGTELRDRSRAVLQRVIAANTASQGRQEQLVQLRAELEQLKVLVRLCHQSGGFATTRSYLYVSEQVVGIAKQNEGWLRSTVNGGAHGRRDRSGESRHGQNPTC